MDLVYMRRDIGVRRDFGKYNDSILSEKIESISNRDLSLDLDSNIDPNIDFNIDLDFDLSSNLDLLDLLMIKEERNEFNRLKKLIDCKKAARLYIYENIEIRKRNLKQKFCSSIISDYLNEFNRYICSDKVIVGTQDLPFDEYEKKIIILGLLNNRISMLNTVNVDIKGFSFRYVIGVLNELLSKLNCNTVSNKNFIINKSINLQVHMEYAINKYPERKYEYSSWYREVFFFLNCLLVYMKYYNESTPIQKDFGRNNLFNRLDYLISNRKNWDRKELNRKRKEYHNRMLEEKLLYYLKGWDISQSQIGNYLGKSQSYISKKCKDIDYINNKNK